MWADIAFQNLHAFRKRFSKPLSDTEIEYHLYQELKQPHYQDLISHYKKSQLPPIVIQECSLFKQDHLLVINNAAQNKGNSIQICSNFLMSQQHLREEFAREITLHALGPFASDSQIACGLVQACKAELNVSNVNADYDTQKLACQKCANHQLKLMTREHHSSRELVASNLHCFDKPSLIQQTKRAGVSGLKFQHSMLD